MDEPTLPDRFKKRKIVQWGLAYLAAAWAILETAGYVGDQFGWPVLVGQTLTVLAAFGLLIVLVLAWYHGEKGRQRIGGLELLILTTLLVVAGFSLSWLRTRAEAGMAPAPSSIAYPQGDDDRPSVAVLPFDNRSSDPEDAYLTAGIHEEVIAQLAKIAGLRVVSRTSVMGYREADKNVREIAAELGVGTVVEGSVQKVLNRVRVNALLIDARSDEELWSNRFDREITVENLLDIQGEVAVQIAGSLEAELTAEEEALIAVRHTESLDAYQAYLRGRYFQHLPHYTQADVARASEEFQRAVELDPDFALAWMESANAHAQQVFFLTDASEERKSLARAAAQTALALESPSPEVRLALAMYHLRLDRNGDLAMEEIVQAEEGLPNNPDVYEAKSTVFELWGRYGDAVAELRKALHLSPGDPSVLTSLSWNFTNLRQFDSALAYGQEAVNQAPDQMWPNLTQALAIWGAQGPTEESERLVERLPHTLDWVIWARFWQRMLEDRYEEALSVLSDPDFEWVRVKMWARPKPLLEAYVLLAMGRTEDAARSFGEARRILEEAAADDPNDPRYRSSLALSLAGLGYRDDAIREGELAVSLLPTSEDAYYGLPYLWDLAAVHAALGNADEAIRGIEHLLEVPSWVSPEFLNGDFRLDSLREDPRFQALLPENSQESEPLGERG
jgi:serine/threonine-protein kinase